MVIRELERGGRAVMGVFAKASFLLHNHNTPKLGYQLGTVLACSFPEREELCVTQGMALGVVSKESVRMKIKLKNSFIKFYCL